MKNKIEKVSLRNFNDEELLNLIYTEYMGIKPKNYKEFYKKSCLPTNVALTKRLHMSYSEILLKAGVPEEYITLKTDKFYIDILIKISKKLGHTPSVKELEREGYYVKTYIKRFGSYNNAVKTAGLIPNKEYSKKVINKEQILRDYKELSRKIGKAATIKDFNNSNLGYSANVAIRKFGSFNNLRKKAGFNIENRGASVQKYNKEIVLSMLVKDYIDKGIRLTVKELKEKGYYPDASTLRYLFCKNSLHEVWTVVAEEAIKELKKREHNRRTNNKVLEAGLRGERNVAHNLSFLSTKEYAVFNDINIYSSEHGESQQIDHLVIGPNGVFAIETKNTTGNIRVLNRGYWEKCTKKDVKSIPNPTQQIIRHENILKSILPNGMPIKSILVIANPFAEVRNAEICPFPIVNVNMILQYIQDYKSERVLKDEEIRFIEQEIKQAMINHKVYRAS